MTRRRKAPNPVSAARTKLVNDNCTQYATTPGICQRSACGKPLTGRSTKWCSRNCATTFTNNHRWTNARKQAKTAAAHYLCADCGHFFRKVEVNHKVPCVGERGWSCHHHSDNLEVLCKACHLAVTNQQRKDGLI